tara:strand:- start:452 stop:682 length:231 start_codon:yes stop_codon:yes gene_type:complete
MNAGSKVILIDLQAFLVIQETLLKFFLELVRLSQIEECARLWSFLCVLDLDDQGPFDNLDGLFASFLFDEHFTLEE